jgi:hypothetical protein
VTVYRCYLMSGERINGMQIIDCSDDEVTARAATLLSSRLEHLGIVIWHDDRLIVRIPRRDITSP